MFLVSINCKVDLEIILLITHSGPQKKVTLKYV